eukprot:jgi/Tetstr1/458519/TSEL_044924.t1
MWRWLYSLTTLLLSCLVGEYRPLQGRALLDVPSCADRRSGETYKPKGGGKFKEKHEDQSDAGRCIDKCVEDGLDVAVYNTGSDSCYCWEEDEGRWEDAGNGDVAYEVSGCGRSTRRGRNDDDDNDDRRRNDSRRDLDDQDDDDKAFDPPSCAEERRSRTYKPRGRGNWERKENSLEKCFDKCFDKYEIIVWNTRTDDCYCWKEEDGTIEMSGGNDILYDLRVCNDDDDGDKRSNDDDSDRRSNDDDSEKSEKSEKSEAKSEESYRSEKSETPRDNDRIDERRSRQPRGPGSYPIPNCATAETVRYFQPYPGSVWARSYDSLSECFVRCFDTSDVISWRADEERCYCYTTADGFWDYARPGGINRDTSYDLLPCFRYSQGIGQLVPGGQGFGGYGNQNPVPPNMFGGAVPGGWNQNHGPMTGPGGQASGAWGSLATAPGTGAFPGGDTGGWRDSTGNNQQVGVQGQGTGGWNPDQIPPRFRLQG